MKRRLIPALTLIEMLVVISILAILMAILLPATTRSREAAKRAVCMSNLRSIGQALYTYSHNNNELLVPGDGRYPWQTWGYIHQVNLGYLLIPKQELPVPTSNNHVFFCPSMFTPEGDRGYKRFSYWWGRDCNGSAPIGYIFNNSLDGFDDLVENAEFCVLSHRDRVNFLLGDGSVSFINVRPMLFDSTFGLETIPQVCTRYNVTFPTIMLFNWFERGEVDVKEARLFLQDPQLWATQNATVNDANNSKSILLASVAKKALVADVVGGWGGGLINQPGGAG
ncbi:MAG: type II secretion system protein [Sedimentisphaerales bacterium]|jgi:prepilin-type N-terminal cleavage/methylation domain-containing protein/prepilin-type processing-associated H-X9-DG protein